MTRRCAIVSRHFALALMMLIHDQELGMDVMKHYKVPSSLQQIDEVVKEGEAYAEVPKKGKGGRADAWR